MYINADQIFAQHLMTFHVFLGNSATTYKNFQITPNSSTSFKYRGKAVLKVLSNFPCSFVNTDENRLEDELLPHSVQAASESTCSIAILQSKNCFTCDSSQASDRQGFNARSISAIITWSWRWRDESQMFPDLHSCEKNKHEKIISPSSKHFTLWFALLENLMVDVSAKRGHQTNVLCSYNSKTTSSNNTFIF